MSASTRCSLPRKTPRLVPSRGLGGLVTKAMMRWWLIANSCPQTWVALLTRWQGPESGRP